MLSFTDLSYYEDMLDLLDSPFNDYTDFSFDFNDSTFSVEDFPREKSKTSRKRKYSESHASSHSEFQMTKTAKESISISPDDAASKYANFFASTLNQQDPNELRRCLKTICSKDARVVLNVYSLKSDRRSPLNHFGNFSYADLSMEEFIAMLSATWEIVPDGFTDILSSRSCCEAESSVYISCFRSTGTIISKDSMIGLADKSGRLYEIRQSNAEVLKHSVMEQYYQTFISEGSLIMYRNREGQISGIEFYYEFAL